MSIGSRIAKLEARADTRPSVPTAAEAAAAYARVVLHVRTDFIARVSGAPLPPRSAEYARDWETLRRYRVSRGAIVLEPNAKERLKAMLDRLAEEDLARDDGDTHRSATTEASE
jgi:hypothetical protein